MSLKPSSSNANDKSGSLRAYRIFEFSWIAILLLVLGIGGGANLLVDPEGRFDLLVIPGLNEAKPTLLPDARAAKSIALHQCSYRYVMIGTSRTDIGINPDYPGFTAGRAYNAAMPNTNMDEMGQLALYAVEQQPDVELLIGLDFLSFTEFEKTNKYDYFALTGNRYSAAQFYHSLNYLFSRNTLKASLLTVRSNQKKGNPKKCQHNGMQDRRSIPVNQREAFNTILSNFTGRYRTSPYSPERVETLKQTLRELVLSETNTSLFISPMHSLQLVLLDELGMLNDFLQWKSDMTVAIDSLNGEMAPREPLVLWDFSGINSITTEPVPADPDAKMTWYRESSHYRVATGDLILDRVLSKQNAAHALPDDFGIPLTGSSLQSSNSSLRQMLKEYKLAYPEDTAMIQNFVATNKQRPDAIAPPIN